MEFIDTLQIIFIFCDFMSQISLISTCTYYRNNLHIIDLFNIDKKYLQKLNQDILHLSIFEKVKYLDACPNQKITRVSHMKFLEILDTDEIDQEGIEGLNLIELYASDNSKITNVSHMKSLQILNAYGNCGINQKGIEGLNLIDLNANHNSKITNVSHMKSLQILCAFGDCGINQKGIEGLNLIELYAYNNSKISQCITHEISTNIRRIRRLWN